MPRGLLAGRYRSIANLIPWYHCDKPLPVSPTWLYSTNFTVCALQIQCHTPMSQSTHERVGKAHSANTVSVSQQPQKWSARAGTCSNDSSVRSVKWWKIHHPGNCRVFPTSWRKNQSLVQLPLDLRGVHCHRGRKKQYCGSGGRDQWSW